MNIGQSSIFLCYLCFLLCWSIVIYVLGNLKIWVFHHFKFVTRYRIMDHIFTLLVYIGFQIFNWQKFILLPTYRITDWLTFSVDHSLFMYWLLNHPFFFSHPSPFPNSLFHNHHSRLLLLNLLIFSFLSSFIYSVTHAPTRV